MEYYLPESEFGRELDLEPILTSLRNPSSILVTLNLDTSLIDDNKATLLGFALCINTSVEHLSLFCIRSITSSGWNAIFLGLSNPNHSLEYLDIGGNNQLGGDLTVAFKALLTNNKLLTCLKLPSAKFENNCWRILGEYLLGSDSILEYLDVSEANINNDMVIALGDVIANSTTLKKLKFNHNENVTFVGGWDHFFTCLSNSSVILEKLVLNYIDGFNDEVAVSLANALSTNNKLKCIHLEDNDETISAAGWQTFFEILQNSNLALEELHLGGNSIDDTVVPLMISVLANTRSLLYLSLYKNQSITSAGWRAVSTLLEHHNSGLEELILQGNNESLYDEAISFVNALAGNTSLQELSLGRVNPSVWDALSNILCDTSTIESIYFSNHTLMGGLYEPNGDIASYLQLNENANKVEVARQKILRYHFKNGEDNIDELVDMEMNVLPQIMSWLGRDYTGQSLLYSFIRSMPTLFDSESMQVRATANHQVDVEWGVGSSSVYL